MVGCGNFLTIIFLGLYAKPETPAHNTYKSDEKGSVSINANAV